MSIFTWRLQRWLPPAVDQQGNVSSKAGPCAFYVTGSWRPLRPYHEKAFSPEWLLSACDQCSQWCRHLSRLACLSGAPLSGQLTPHLSESVFAKKVARGDKETAVENFSTCLFKQLQVRGKCLWFLPCLTWYTPTNDQKSTVRQSSVYESSCSRSLYSCTVFPPEETPFWGTRKIAF